jgi:hypothetical protein
MILVKEVTMIKILGAKDKTVSKTRICKDVETSERFVEEASPSSTFGNGTAV